MSDYKFQEPVGRPAFGALPEGNYQFVVVECDEPARNAKGNLVLHLRLSIQPNGEPVWANPWAGVDKNGKSRDQIAEFLICINRRPKIGEEPDWTHLVGCKGTCRLTTETSQQGSMAGKEVNRVDYFIIPKVAGTPQGNKPGSFAENDFAKARQAQAKAAGAPTKPDDLPF